MSLEELAKTIFDECAKEGEPVTLEEALEMAKMEIGAKDIKNYTQSDNSKLKKVSKPRTVKISDEKQRIFDYIVNALQKDFNICIEIDNKLIKITENGKVFKLDLIETRKKK